jgi:hypothetical protein
MPVVTTNPYSNNSPLGALQTTLLEDDHLLDSQAVPVHRNKGLEMNLRSRILKVFALYKDGLKIVICEMHVKNF